MLVAKSWTPMLVSVIFPLIGNNWESCFNRSCQWITFVPGRNRRSSVWQLEQLLLKKCHTRKTSNIVLAKSSCSNNPPQKAKTVEIESQTWGIVKLFAAASPAAADHSDLMDKDVRLFSKNQNNLQNNLKCYQCFWGKVFRDTWHNTVCFHDAIMFLF